MPVFPECIISVFVTIFLLACSSPDGDDSSTPTPETCQQFCEDENAGYLESESCIACSVSCVIAENGSAFSCMRNDCDQDVCQSHCEEKSPDFPIGRCNQVLENDIYWGCNCFAISP